MKKLLFLFGVALLIIFLIYLSVLYLEFKRIKRNTRVLSKKMTPEQVDAIIKQMKIVKRMNFIDSTSNEKLLRLAKVDWKVSALVLTLIMKVAPIVIVYLAISTYLMTKMVFVLLFLIVCAIMVRILPESVLKSKINDRRIAHNKMFGYMWRLQQELSINDQKSTFMIMSEYFSTIGETELSNLFEAYYNLMPKEPSGINDAVSKLEEDYPFPIAVQLYNILLECWANAQPADSRLESFKASAILAYKREADDILSKLPAKGALYTVPGFLIATTCALIVPAFYQVIQALNSSGF